VLDSGGKQAYVNYDGGMFVFQTPRCTLPYGMSAFDKAGPVKYLVELSLRGYEDPANKMNSFYQALTQLDDYMIDQGVKNSRAWFKSDLSRDVVKAFYTPMVRYAKDKEGNPKPYPPTIKLSLRQKRDSQDFDVQCFDDKKPNQLYRGIPLEELLVKGAEISSLVQCTGLWFAGSKYGLSWKLVQAIIQKLPQSARGFTFVDEGESEVKASTTVASAHEEEEEEEEEEDEAFTAPPPPVKKTVLNAVLPKATPTPVASTLDDEADDAEPVPIPKKTATTPVVKKKIVPKGK